MVVVDIDVELLLGTGAMVEDELESEAVSDVASGSGSADGAVEPVFTQAESQRVAMTQINWYILIGQRVVVAMSLMLPPSASSCLSLPTIAASEGQLTRRIRVL